jgi:hypothetical protein
LRNGAERSQWGAAIAVLTFVAAVLVGAVFSSNQVVHADTCIYDVATVACVDVRTGAGADAGSAQLTGVRELATSPPAGTRGPSTTSSGSLVATNTVDDAVSITKPYSRPSGATTPAQRASVQGQPCVDCGTISPVQVADHKVPLVQEYYTTGTIDTTRMRALDAVQAQCPTCSAQQGAAMAQYSKLMKKSFGLE